MLLTRKTLGGIETNLDGACLNPDGSVLTGLHATAAEAGRLAAGNRQLDAGCHRAASGLEGGI